MNASSQMPSNQRWVIVCVAVAISVLIFELVRKRKLREEYSWLWILSGLGLAILSFTPFELLLNVSQMIFGTERPTAAVFFVGFIFVTLLCLQFSVRLSRMTEQVKNLAQKIAILEADLADTQREAQAREPGERA